MSADRLDDAEVEGDPIESRMGSHVEEIMSAARKAAAQLQAEVERASSERMAQIETAAARRAHTVRMTAEAEAESVHAQARATTQQYVTASRRLVDEFAKERMRRIAEIGDRLADQAEALVEPLARADDLARQVADLRTALGAACERIASETQGPAPELPELPSPEPLAQAAAPSPGGDEDGAAESAAPELTLAPTLEERFARAVGRNLRRVSPPEEQSPPAVEPDADEEERADGR